MSESFITALFLVMSGGLQDAYTYCCRNMVFANAQTGNIVLMSAHFFEREWVKGFRYLIPVSVFAAGVFIAELIHRQCKYMHRMHWRQMILLMEILILFVVGFVPNSLNTLANAMVSFACALQVQTFRKVDGAAYASTMCIGNLRSGTEALCAYLHNHERNTLKKAAEYFAVILLFGLGAGIGSKLTDLFGARAIWLSCVLLTVSFCMMFIRERQEELDHQKEKGGR